MPLQEKGVALDCRANQHKAIREIEAGMTEMGRWLFSVSADRATMGFQTVRKGVEHA